MVGVRITMEGVDVVSRRFEGIAERAADLTGVWPRVLDVIITLLTIPAFLSEGATTDDSAWAPLARTTQLERARLGFGPEHPILRRTDTLFNSLTQPGNPGMVWLTTPTRAAFGSNVNYFKYHQSRRPRKKIPRRAPVSPTQGDKHAIIHPIRLWVTGMMPAGYRGEERTEI